MIFRVSISTYGEELGVSHLVAIKDFLEPWTKNQRTVIVDGDLCLLILAKYGLSSFVSTTFPRMQMLKSREASIPRSSFMQKPDGFYVKALLGRITPDQTASLRGNTVGRTLTNCDCPYCSISFMKRNKASNWNRTERRKHFVSVIPREIKQLRKLSSQQIKDRIDAARREIGRFKKLVPMNISHLDAWSDFLSHNP